MDQMLSEKMKALLADPDAMARMMDMAGKLFSGMGNENGEEKKEVREQSPLPFDGAALAGIASAMKGMMGEGGSDGKAALPTEKREESREKREEKQSHSGGCGDEDRIRLISALCPYLNSGRREAAQAMIRILKLMSMANAAGLFGRAN